jgi:uncharacterized membrane protein YecN with MAPEG domain
MPRLAKFFKLSAIDKFLILHCLFVVALVRIALSLLSYRVLHRFLRQKVPHTSSNNGKVDRIVNAVGRASRFVPQASCLTQALAAQFILARAGLPSQVRVGVAIHDQGKFVAHAWLIRDGRVVMGGTAEEIQRYATLVDLNLGPS